MILNPNYLRHLIEHKNFESTFEKIRYYSFSGNHRETLRRLSHNMVPTMTYAEYTSYPPLGRLQSPPLELSFQEKYMRNSFFLGPSLLFYLTRAYKVAHWHEPEYMLDYTVEGYPHYSLD